MNWKWLGAVGMVVVMWGGAALGAEPKKELVPAELEKVIDRGLFYLQGQQRGEDGSFEADGAKNAMAGLGLMAFLASGNTQDFGKYGLTVRRAVDFLVNQNPPDGYFGHEEHEQSRMYGQCIVTIALAQAYGMETDEGQRRKVRQTLDKALKVILVAQEVKKDANNAGGWRYEPNAPDSDLSVTGWCTLALRACQNAGVPVPREHAQRATGYILACYSAEKGAFAYQPRGAISAAMTGAGVLDLCLLDQGERAEVRAGSRYLAQTPVKAGEGYYYYTMFSTTMGAFAAGDQTFEKVWPRNLEQLLSAQRKEDGSWPASPKEPGSAQKKGRFYSTAMAVLTLSVPLRLLPVEQR